ncbi:MAG: hypothetical protein IPJ34_07170 [Myxococcales bacterium]|nr:hypothetical protein [Myxococcales bacterium]
MRKALVLALLLLSCRGETVEAPVAGDAAGDATAEAAPDGSTDTSAADVEAGACTLKGSILVNGAFETGTSGWLKNSCKTEPIPGPCGGSGIRVFDVINYGSIGQIVARKLPKGTRVRARAYFKQSGTLGGSPPYLEVGSIRYVDGGGVRGGLGFTLADIGPTWVAVETTGVLTEDAAELFVGIASKRAEADEFAVAAVSLVVE